MDRVKHMIREKLAQVQDTKKRLLLQEELFVRHIAQASVERTASGGYHLNVDAAMEMITELQATVFKDRDTTDLRKKTIARLQNLTKEEIEDYLTIRSHQELVGEADKILRQLILPPPVTAQNLEVLAMSFAAYCNVLQDLSVRVKGALKFEHLPDSWFRASRAFFAAGFSTFNEAELIVSSVDGLNDFLEDWYESSYARLEVSHKLAAAMCLTDVPDSDDMQAPWSAWSLLVPDGLLENDVARVWCSGKGPVFLVTMQGKLQPWSEASYAKPVRDMLVSLVRSACLALADQTRRRTIGRWGTPTSSVSKRRHKGPPPPGARYLLAHPVIIDLRAAVREAVTGRRPGGGSPKVQFLVRGHWRNQAYGPKMALRRRQWIEPFWKGDEEARVLLRSYRVSDEVAS
jgi:hypothetical protein